jgi:hypothetical protein
LEKLPVVNVPQVEVVVVLSSKVVQVEVLVACCALVKIHSCQFVVKVLVLLVHFAV